MHHQTDAEFVGHEPCPSCGSSDALARYDDGHGWCFACQSYQHPEGEEAGRTSNPRKKMAADLIEAGEFRPLGKRGITEETCKKWGYTVGRYAEQTVQIANYRDASGTIVAQKVRFPNKDFKFLGDTKAAGLYGQHLWRDGGKMLVITEGEIDALSVSQVQGNKWPVVSIPNGASGAKKSIMKELEWVESFDSVILMFDMDEPGRKAAEECALLLTPGKAKIASLPEGYKDANDMLVAGEGKALIDAMWGAKNFRPDGILNGEELWAQVATEEDVVSIDYPWQGLNTKTRGARMGELVTVTAGSGIGKSAVVREIANWLIKQGETVGMIMLEESTKRTALGLMGIHLDKPLHIDRTGVSEDELRQAFEATVGSGRVFLYDHFGSSDLDNLLARVRYLAKGCGCRWIVLDHLSIVVSGLGDGDERRLIDNAMTQLRTLVQETGIGLFLVSHLKRPEKRGHEEGAQTSLSQLRGSHAIAQLSDMVLGLERNQQGSSPNVTTIRVLKNRFTGETGEACFLIYNPETGRLTETDEPFEDETEGRGGEEF